MQQTSFQPDKISSYFYMEWKNLTAVTISGLVYNIGLLANPWFDGKLAGCLADRLSGKASFQQMLILAGCYVGVILCVQIARYLKRLYVRRFSNNINRRMKQILYHNLIHKSKSELDREGSGTVITKAISDVDDCSEGMRKFTTEVFDTGVALTCYMIMLFCYDWRLSLITLLFPPVSYLIAEKMKCPIQKTGQAYKLANERLSDDTLDIVHNSITYRLFSCDPQRQHSYENCLSDYEYAACRANIPVAALPPLYQIISMAGCLFIIWFGSKNILGNGWTHWDIAAFTTFLSCYTKLSVKSSKAAKLFNSVHRAQVSWKRIKPFMKDMNEDTSAAVSDPAVLEVHDLGFSYPAGEMIFSGLSFRAEPGQIIGITGPVASGKTTLGTLFLCEYPYRGSVRFDGQELSELSDDIRYGIIGYSGHDPELLNDSIENNILMGKQSDAKYWLKKVCLDREVAEMKNGIDTIIGNEGVRLSGGQAQRLALARTLYHLKPVLILDDPFSAVDKKTEAAIYKELKEIAQNSIVLLISHRLSLFPQMDQVIWINQGQTAVGTHTLLMDTVPLYADLYRAQQGGLYNEKK